MMAHLLDSLDAGTDIGRYGRFGFATIARHFLSEDELVSLLARDEDFNESEARRLVYEWLPALSTPSPGFLNGTMPTEAPIYPIATYRKN